MLEADFTSIDELNVIIAGDKPRCPAPSAPEAYRAFVADLRAARKFAA
jgi:hypothetical protein